MELSVYNVGHSSKLYLERKGSSDIFEPRYMICYHKLLGLKGLYVCLCKLVMIDRYILASFLWLLMMEDQKNCLVLCCRFLQIGQSQN